jgi:hypothetical protein
VSALAGQLVADSSTVLLLDHFGDVVRHSPVASIAELIMALAAHQRASHMHSLLLMIVDSVHAAQAT